MKQGDCVVTYGQQLIYLSLITGPVTHQENRLPFQIPGSITPDRLVEKIIIGKFSTTEIQQPFSGLPLSKILSGKDDVTTINHIA